MLWGSTIISRIISGAAILLLLVVFQSLLSNLVAIMGVRLDLAIIVLVYGVIFGFLIGLLLDVFNRQALGWGALIKCLIGFSVGSFKDNLYLESLYSKAGLIFFALLFNDFLYYIFTVGPKAAAFGKFSNHSLPSAFYTAVVGMLVFLAVSKIQSEWSESQKSSFQYE
jgi:rod shape-determining protein MreD